ncbi:MAG: hypothetical protein VYE40_12920 [Myxococcota bacterium]|jgi:hypothetical protein|nr:hypothetical protein [Myxococcota bacterium]MEC9441998.1 hypothetical protein [Myxococcota bacterium]
MSDFGELRSLVMGPCDVLAWEKICALLDAFRPEQRAEYVPYVREHTRGWDALVRKNPVSWFERALAGEDVPELRLVGHLALGGKRARRGANLERLEKWVDPKEVRALEVRGPVVARGGLARLFDGVLFEASIASVSVVRGELGLAGLEAIMRSRQTRFLRELSFSREQIGAWGARALAEDERAGQLERLTLRDIMLDANAIDSLLLSEVLRPVELCIEHIDMSSCRANWPQCTADVRQLRINHCNLGEMFVRESGLVDFLDQGREKLVELELEGNQITAFLLHGFASRGICDELVSLSLADNPIGDSGLGSLLRSLQDECLERLNLDGCELTDDGAVALATCEHLGGLQTLGLRRNDIGERGRRALRGSAVLREELWERSS